MNKQRAILLTLALAVIGGTAFGMHWLKTNQRLGRPGIRTTAIEGSPRVNIYLPEKVLDYDSQLIPTDEGLLIYMPHDTSFMQRRYLSPQDEGIFTNIGMMMNVVLMGTDRTSIHKPQFCLTGIGWNISETESSEETLRIERPHPYDLPVMKLIATREFGDNGHNFKLRGIYVYWFVADNQLTARHADRMWKSATHLLRTGELQRWAYVSCFTVCRPGEETATYERMKKFIGAAVPEFQLAANPQIAERSPALAATATPRPPN